MARITVATYIIGDVQGCFDALQALLDKIHYDPAVDRLGFAGDLINRGTRSLDTLRFIHQLDDPIVVLGNHDLYLLALHHGLVGATLNEDLQAIFDADDREILLGWLQQQPLLRVDYTLGYALVHAGIPPQWTLKQAESYANEVNQYLQQPSAGDFLAHHMEGNHPLDWQEDLSGHARLRYIINGLTRMRFCTESGRLNLNNHQTNTDNPDEQPWFCWQKPKLDIIFGHWASLKGKINAPGYYGLDTGCVWGGCLRAMRIEDRQLFEVPC